MTMTEPFRRTVTYRCPVTRLMFPASHYGGTRGLGNSVMGNLYVNVSQRAINGRYSAVRASHYPTNSHHRKHILMDETWVDDPTLFALDILTAIGCPRVCPHTGHKLSLDRINNDDGYYIGNLQWATAHQQAMNRDFPGELTHYEVMGY